MDDVFKIMFDFLNKKLNSKLFLYLNIQNVLIYTGTLFESISEKKSKLKIKHKK